MVFPCTKCGACCKRAHLIENFQYVDYKNTGCKKLNDNKCSIYLNRPFICNMEKVRNLLFSNIKLKEYYKISAIICNKLMQEDKMDESYLIDLKQFED